MAGCRVVAGCKRRNGFTLIEVLIAMTLLGIMVALLFSSLKIAAESWNAGESKIVEVNRKAVVYQFFKRHLTTIRPVSIQSMAEHNIGGQTEIVEPAFQGQRQSMRFVAALPASAARKGLQVFEIAAVPNDASTLRVALSPYQSLEAAGEPEPVVLLEHVNAYAFFYFGKKDQAAEAAAWHEDWIGIAQLPQLIKVVITLDDGSFWPEMVFAPKINGQAVSDNVAAGFGAAMRP